MDGGGGLVEGLREGEKGRPVRCGAVRSGRGGRDSSPQQQLQHLPTRRRAVPKLPLRPVLFSTASEGWESGNAPVPPASTSPSSQSSRSADPATPSDVVGLRVAAVAHHELEGARVGDERRARCGGGKAMRRGRTTF